jgi:hypothetical protein
MAFIGKYKLFQAEVSVDEALEVFMVLFILLQSSVCDLQDVVSIDQVPRDLGKLTH